LDDVLAWYLLMYWILFVISHELFYKLVDESNDLLLTSGLGKRSLRDGSLESFNTSGSIISV